MRRVFGGWRRFAKPAGAIGPPEFNSGRQGPGMSCAAFSPGVCFARVWLRVVIAPFHCAQASLERHFRLNAAMRPHLDTQAAHRMLGAWQKPGPRVNGRFAPPLPRFQIRGTRSRAGLPGMASLFSQFGFTAEREERSSLCFRSMRNCRLTSAASRRRTEPSHSSKRL